MRLAAPHGVRRLLPALAVVLGVAALLRVAFEQYLNYDARYALLWARDLVGCTVVDGSREVGVVARMLALPSCEALEVGELLIPMVRDAIRSIDVEARRIDVDMGFVGE